MASSRKKALPRCIEFGPPELSPEAKKKAEKGFILDGVAVATFSDDSGHASPKLSTAIPPYNAQKDKHAQSYFKSKDVVRTLKKTDMNIKQALRSHLPGLGAIMSRSNSYPTGPSINGDQVDYFYQNGRMGKYVELRNNAGAGHSTAVVGGHDLFMTNSIPINGYNGPFGFRRNTPWLRESPSSFQGPVDNRSVVP